jgi:hypothetical protein
MRMHQGQPPFRHVITTAALAAALGAVVLGLSQCRSIDNPMSASLRSSSGSFDSGSPCQRRCREEFKLCMNRENTRFRQAIQQCNQLPPEQRDACVAAEEQRHEREVEACAAARQACLSNCEYREGSGRGGR